MTGNIELSSRILKAGRPAFSYVSPLHPKVNLNIIVMNKVLIVDASESDRRRISGVLNLDAGCSFISPSVISPSV